MASLRVILQGLQLRRNMRVPKRIVRTRFPQQACLHLLKARKHIRKDVLYTFHNLLWAMLFCRIAQDTKCMNNVYQKHAVKVENECIQDLMQTHHGKGIINVL